MSQYSPQSGSSNLWKDQINAIYNNTWTTVINFINTKANCWPVKGRYGRCLSEFRDWRYSQSCWYFRPSCVNCCPSNLLSGSTTPPPPQLLKSHYIILMSHYVIGIYSQWFILWSSSFIYQLEEAQWTWNLRKVHLAGVNIVRSAVGNFCNNCQLKNKEALGYFKRLSHDEGRADFAKKLYSSPLIKAFSINTTFSSMNSGFNDENECRRCSWKTRP